MGGFVVSNKDTWLFATVAHGLSAVTCIWVAVSHLLRDRKLSFVTVCSIINSILWPINFALALRNYLRAREEELEQDCIPF